VTVVALTSLIPGPEHFERQSLCVRSWRERGCARVVAFSSERDRPRFAAYEGLCDFAPAEYCEELWENQLPTIEGMLRWGAEHHPGDTLLLVNSDCELVCSAPQLAEHASDGVAFLLREDVGAEGQHVAQVLTGVDGVLLPASRAGLWPAGCRMIVGRSVWDYVLPFQCALAGVPLYRPSFVTLRHLTHPQRWDARHTDLGLREAVRRLGWRFARFHDSFVRSFSNAALWLDEAGNKQPCAASVMLATPVADKVETDTVQSVEGLRDYLMQLGYQVPPWQFCKGGLVDANRNLIAEWMLESRCTVLVQFDADHVFKPADVAPAVNFVASGRADVVGFAHPWKRDTREGGRLGNLVSPRLFDDYSKHTYQVFQGRQFMSVWGVGTGILVTSRRCLEKMYSTARAFGDSAHRAIFDAKTGYGEDLAFCNDWREKHGGVVWCDAQADIGHIGSKVYHGDLAEELGHVERRWAVKTAPAAGKLLGNGEEGDPEAAAAVRAFLEGRGT